MSDKKNTSREEAKEMHYLEALCAMERMNALIDGVNMLVNDSVFDPNPTNKRREAFVEAATWCADHLATIARDEFKQFAANETAPDTAAVQSTM